MNDAQTTPAAAPAGARRRKILLVEDDEEMAKIYQQRLELEGFEVGHAKNGEEALDTAVKFVPDLILLDVMMPRLNGFEVLDILRNTPATRNARIMMMTALGQPQDRDRAMSLGADDYLVKSQVVIGDVIERIKHHLGVA